MESRIHGDMYVRFGGRLVETYHRKVEKRCWPSLRMKMKTSSFYVNMVRFLTVHIATIYGSAWMVISMTRTKVTQFTLQ